MFYQPIYDSFIRCLCVISLWPMGAIAAEKLTYNQHIRPILSDKCFQCHGPDAAKREAKLRLDVRDDALESGAFIPGNSKASELISRLHATDPDEVMPPPKSPRQLNDAERATLALWIDQGAEYQPHWSFSPLPESIAVPKSTHPTWPKNEIDQFISARHDQEGLTPSPAASPERWLRRVTFDLTGLPPTQHEIDHFLADETSVAREKAVTRLLASPHYGEKMALAWLDIARYADSFGYQADIDTHAWPYRDWVVSAYNQNLPWNDFITWQIAGDLLPNPTREQVIATAFNRIHRKTNEGGSVEAEFRQDGISDRVHTFGFAFLALTFECTRCHDHKYDPLTQQDYYSMGGFFNSIDEWGLINGNDKVPPSPTLLLTNPEQDQKIAEQKLLVAAAEKVRSEISSAHENEFQKWLISPTAISPDFSGSYDLDAVENEHFSNLGSTKEPAKSPSRNTLVVGHHGQALLFTGDDALILGKHSANHAEDPLSMAFWLKPGEQSKRTVVFHNTSGKDTGYSGIELLLEDGKLRWNIAREWPGNCISILSHQALPLNEWSHIVVSYDGSSSAAGLKIFINGKPQTAEISRDHLTKNCLSGRVFAFGERTRDAGLRGGIVDDIRLFTRVLTSLEITAFCQSKPLLEIITTTARDDSGMALLREFYHSAIAEKSRAAASKLHAARHALRMTMDGVAELPIMKEMAEKRPVHVLARGEYSHPEGAALARNTPSALPAFPDELPRNRLGLARWLTEPNHPLTARVQVNRVWQQFFNRGLVATSENFGTQGESPSHPELLDWLARDFISHGWNMKRLCQQIVLSATYQQESIASPALRLKDPANLLLARGPAKRLSGEEIRDQALAISGLLHSTLGGPSTMPYLPDAATWKVTNNYLPDYQRDAAPNIYRRSLYTFWRRTVPPPGMLAFDVPGRDVCTVRRQQTNTPLQPLVMLNDPQFVEAARGLAIRSIREGGSDLSSRIAWLFRQALGRAATPTEIQLLLDLYSEQLEIFRSDFTQADAYLKVGDLRPPADISAIDLAAASILASAIINLDEAITLR